MKHFRRADVFISLGITSHHKYGIFSANLRKFYCLLYKNEGICLMIDRSLCGLGGLHGASVGGGMVMTACMPSRHFYFVLLLFLKKVNLKGIDHTHVRHEYRIPEGISDMWGSESTCSQ